MNVTGSVVGFGSFPVFGREACTVTVAGVGMAPGAVYTVVDDGPAFDNVPPPAVMAQFTKSPLGGADVNGARLAGFGFATVEYKVTVCPVYKEALVGVI